MEPGDEKAGLAQVDGAFYAAARVHEEEQAQGEDQDQKNGAECKAFGEIHAAAKLWMIFRRLRIKAGEAGFGRRYEAGPPKLTGNNAAHSRGAICK